MAEQDGKINPVQLQKFLGGIDYPAEKEQIVETARDNDAPDDVVEFLERLPMDRFNSPNDVSEAAGKANQE
jgi:hypothetical protein